MRKLMFMFIVTFLAINSPAAQKDYWEHEGSAVSFGCFTFQDLMVESYPRYYQSKYKISRRAVDDFVDNPGMYFKGSAKKYESNPYTSNINDYGHGISIVNIDRCLINKKGFQSNYQLRMNVSKELCNKLAPNLNGTCKKAAYLAVHNLYGGSANRGFLYIYGQFDIDGKDYIVPLKRFHHYKDAQKFVKDKKIDVIKTGYNVDLKTEHKIIGNKVVFTVKSKNLVNTGKGGISISFPQFSTTKRITNKEKIGFKNISSYKKGKKIWNREIKKTVKNSYLLVEGWSKKWRKNEEKIIKITVDIKNLERLIVHVRTNIVSGKKEYVNPIDSTFYNQQGYYDKVLKISL